MGYETIWADDFGKALLVGTVEDVVGRLFVAGTWCEVALAVPVPAERREFGDPALVNRDAGDGLDDYLCLHRFHGTTRDVGALLRDFFFTSDGEAIRARAGGKPLLVVIRRDERLPPADVLRDMERDRRLLAGP